MNEISLNDIYESEIIKLIAHHLDASHFVYSFSFILISFRILVILHLIQPTRLRYIMQGWYPIWVDLARVEPRRVLERFLSLVTYIVLEVLIWVLNDKLQSKHSLICIHLIHNKQYAHTVQHISI